MVVRNFDASKKQNEIVQRKRKKGIEMELAKGNTAKQRKVVEKQNKKSSLAKALFS